MMHITKIQRTQNSKALFSIVIPSWNNLPYLQLCIKSILQHSAYSHQIIVHVNEGKDGTLDWIASQENIDYTFSEENAGVCYAINAAASLAATNYILYLNDDMYVCPNWDAVLKDEIDAIGHSYFFLSATAIEPSTKNPCAIEKNYGTDIQSFNEKKLLEEFNSLHINDWSGATWPPNVVHKDIWDLVGGYSIEFSPGMYSDPDFSMKLWQAGIRIFKGCSKSRVYHFGSKSVKRVKKNRGYFQFIKKWGMTSSTLDKYFIQRGKRYQGVVEAREMGWMVQLKNKFKQIQAVFKL